MNKSKFLAIGLVVVVAAALGAYGLHKGVFKTGDLVDAGKVTVQGGDPIKALCAKYVAEKDVVIAPAALAPAVSQAAPGTPVVAPTPAEGVTTTTVTPQGGPVPLGMPLPEGSGPQPPGRSTE